MKRQHAERREMTLNEAESSRSTQLHGPWTAYITDNTCKQDQWPAQKVRIAALCGRTRNFAASSPFSSLTGAPTVSLTGHLTVFSLKSKVARFLQIPFGSVSRC